MPFLAQTVIPDSLGSEGTLKIPVIRKLLEEAVFPVEGTAIDLLPFYIMFALLAAGTIATLKMKHRQRARRVVQTCSALAFVVGVHPCMCMIRDTVLGSTLLAINTLEAFKYMMIFCVVASFGLIYGRIFCGWICPLGFFQEVSTAYFNWSRKHRLGGIRTVLEIAVVVGGLVAWGGLGLHAVAPFVGPVVALMLVYLVVPSGENSLRWARWGLTVALLVYIASYFYVLRPGTFGFIETVAVWWVMALLVITLFVVGDPKLDARLKPMKFVSVGLMTLIIVIGIYTNGPFCIFFQSVVDVSTVLSAMGIIVLSGIHSNAWCRYMCPEGAVLGLLARHSRWKITKLDSHCNACRECEPVCPVEAMAVGERDESTCILCSRCVDACPTGALILEDASADTRQGRPPAFVPLEALLKK
jgi:polyferredoxin